MRLIGLAVVLAVSLILAPVAAEAQQADRLRDLATELVDLKVDLTVTGALLRRGLLNRRPEASP